MIHSSQAAVVALWHTIEVLSWGVWVKLLARRCVAVAQPTTSSKVDDRCGGPIARGEVNTAATSAVRVRVPDTSKHPPHSRRVVVSLLPLSYRVL
jgi:hypothetical protein